MNYLPYRDESTNGKHIMERFDKTFSGDDHGLEFKNSGNIVLPVESKKISDLVREMEAKQESSKSELEEVRATLYVNFGPEQTRNPKLISNPNMNTISMLISVLEHYLLKDQPVSNTKENP